MPVVHLLLVVFIVLAVLGLAWWLLGTLALDARIKTVINFLFVIGLVIWLLLWVLPRLITIVG